MWFDPSILISIILEAIDKNPPTVEVHVLKSPLYAMNNYINYNKTSNLQKNWISNNTSGTDVFFILKSKINI